MFSLWSIADIADTLALGVRLAGAERDREQAVYGIDNLDELELHPLLQQALRAAEHGVFPEQRYPGDRGKRKLSEGERCDLVLTPDGRALDVPAAQGTLFAEPNPVPLDEAFWLEVKVVAQWKEDGPNPRYTSELLEPVRRDVHKLAKDQGIRHAGVLLVLFTSDRQGAEHDLHIWQDRCLERNLPIGAPSIRHERITDRLGNSVVTLALYPVSDLLDAND
jgi:hypothetical protein